MVFFIALGTRLAFGNFTALLPAIIISSIIVIIVKPLIILIIMGFLGYTKNTSFKTAVSLGQVSEFSLVFVILGSKAGLVSSNVLAILTIVALISIAVSTYLIIYANTLFTLFEEHLSAFERRKKHLDHESKQYYELVLFGYQKGGHEFLSLFKSLKKRYIVIDYDPDVIDELERKKTSYLYGDATDAELLEEIGLDRAKLVVSTITDHASNILLIKFVERINPNAVIILHAENVTEASFLYELGASYVIIPHYIGSEKITAFIKRSGLNKNEFKKYREKHLTYLETNYSTSEGV